MWDLLAPGNIAVFTLSLLAVWLINTIFQRRRLPPGPFPLPIVGHFLHAKQHKNLTDFSQHYREKYGRIFHWKVGKFHVVHISDLKLMHEAFVKKSSVFSHRGQKLFPFGRRIIEKFGAGLANNDGPEWKELRRISLTAMRNLGVGKKSLEEKIMDEVSLILGYINQQNGSAHCYKELMVKATSNVICNVVFGDRFDYEDPKFLNLLEHVSKLFSRPNGLLTSPVSYFPILEPLAMAVQSRLSGPRVMEETLKYIHELSQEHETTYDPNNIRDFVDLTIKFKKENAGQNQKIQDHNLQRVIVDLFVAGSDTTANTLYWGLLYMAAYPEVQAKCQKEIDDVVGRSRSVTLDDKSSLRYVEATILETLRMGIIAAFTILHLTTEDVELAGYILPKHSIVQACIAQLCRDPELWDEPDTFEPRRFLDSENNVINKDRIVNFSMGPRACVGELLAKMELHLIFPSILQHFNILPASKDAPIDIEPFQGLTRQGKEQDLILTKR